MGFHPSRTLIALIGMVGLATLANGTAASLSRAGDAAVTDPRFAAAREKAARAAEPCRFRPESGQFDFWVGEWDVHPNGATQTVATSRIEKILADCVIFENWTHRNGWSGKSFSLYDATQGKWQQTWVDQSGTMTHFVDSELGDGFLRLITAPVERNGQRVIRRMTFYRQGPDRVRQHGQQSTDGGRTWQDQYDFIYERRR